MALVRFQPFVDEFQSLQERMNRFFGDAGLTRFATEETMGAWTPLCDIYEDGESIVVKTEIPGMDRSDLDVQVENNILTIRGERRREKDVKADTVYRAERFYGSFSRSFTLPVTVDTERIKAEYRDGILHVTLPKVDAAKPRKIKVLTA